MIEKILKKMVGDPAEKQIKKLRPIVKEINLIEEEHQKTLSKADIPKKTAEFKSRLEAGETLEDIKREAFALVKFAARSICGESFEVMDNTLKWEMIPYDVQILGGLIMNDGNIAEMKTGEGKTLVCTMPAYLNALSGNSVFIVTVNNYLAQRDAIWMSALYNVLGLTVGTIYSQQPGPEKKEAYNSDIIYGTNNEFGFDYLRDNMAQRKEDINQVELSYAIIDEVDSILIDEARTPLIISAPENESTTKYEKYSRIIPQLVENKHFNIDEKMKTAVLSEEGITRLEEILNMKNIYTEAGFSEVHHIEQALKAYTVFKKDIDYVVKNGEILIVDEFTGRLMPGRRYSNGLHQAIEAKENVKIQKSSKTLASITFQNYFRMFDKLAGMTGTAETEAEEFAKIYSLNTFVIPTNRPIQRQDLADLVYKNKNGKHQAIVKKVQELHQKGQPVLIGTVSIEQSELLSHLLTINGVKHNVLNAKQHAKEAEIVKNAGQPGAITIATNMAGRGTDIKLGEGVLNLEGLYIIGTERHESRRIDNQLRGRAGRQGDIGASQFYVSMEDDLMRLFGAEKILNMMNALGMPDEMPIENGMITGSIENAQKKVEGRNFDIRKHLVQYDDVMNKQRTMIYKRRRELFEEEKLKNIILLMIEREAQSIVINHASNRKRSEWDVKEIVETTIAIKKSTTHPLHADMLTHVDSEDKLFDIIKNYLWAEYKKVEDNVPSKEIFNQFQLTIALRTIDTLWMEHINQMTEIRDATSLAGYGQRDPLIVYKGEAFELFQQLLAKIQSGIVNTLFKAEIVPQEAIKSQMQEMLKSQQTNQADIEQLLQGIKKRPTNQNISQFNENGIKVKVVESNASHTKAQYPNINFDKVGRNDPCPCGSGKKYKKCCNI